ncbi:winged helix-turn-helix transcriptional regulator [Lysobacter koreensis]|uniref:Winged helix-turn-helix transcriptional regulator n=1 Tax=Lysobacter koreensis TaxID=266122 RepID=A0ABW2YNM2_9GAMM
MKSLAKRDIAADPTQRVYRCLEDVIGCKWSVSVLLALHDGVRRPGELVRHIPGLSTKVLNERLRKLGHYGLIEQHRYPEVPPRTEYTLTAFGQALLALVGQIRELDRGRQRDSRAIQSPAGTSSSSAAPSTKR